MKWTVFACVMLALSACSAPAERRVADSPFVLSSEEEIVGGEDRSFAYLSDEISDHFDDCERGLSHVFSAVNRSIARDWERLEKTLR